MEMSENMEAMVVLVTELGAVTSGFIAAIPIPIEWKAPLLALPVGITGALFSYWKLKINKRK